LNSSHIILHLLSDTAESNESKTDTDYHDVDEKNENIASGRFFNGFNSLSVLHSKLGMDFIHNPINPIKAGGAQSVCTFLGMK
jgi:hypothetical protein